MEPHVGGVGEEKQPATPHLGHTAAATSRGMREVARSSALTLAAMKEREPVPAGPEASRARAATSKRPHWSLLQRPNTAVRCEQVERTRLEGLWRGLIMRAQPQARQHASECGAALLDLPVLEQVPARAARKVASVSGGRAGGGASPLPASKAASTRRRWIDPSARTLASNHHGAKDTRSAKGGSSPGCCPRLRCCEEGDGPSPLPLVMGDGASMTLPPWSDPPSSATAIGLLLPGEGAALATHVSRPRVENGCIARMEFHGDGGAPRVVEGCMQYARGVHQVRVQDEGRFGVQACERRCLRAWLGAGCMRPRPLERWRWRAG